MLHHGKKTHSMSIIEKRQIACAITEKRQIVCAIMEKRQIACVIIEKRQIACVIMTKKTDNMCYRKKKKKTYNIGSMYYYDKKDR